MSILDTLQIKQVKLILLNGSFITGTLDSFDEQILIIETKKGKRHIFMTAIQEIVVLD